ncbi:CPLN1 protein, partial [Galbula dea]|nr:CPLN1 protein [Galbula dea]
MFLQKNTSRGRMRNAANYPINSRHSAEYTVSRTSEQKPPHVAVEVQTVGVGQESNGLRVSPWTVPDDVQRILQNTYDSFQAYALHPPSSSPVDIIDADGASESTGSILSKLDWNAIDAMVADVEEM